MVKQIAVQTSLLRWVFAASIIFVSLGCDSKRGLKDASKNQIELAPLEIESLVDDIEWVRFVRNEWYEASELRLDDQRSVIHWKLFKSDPQLGIRLAIDLGVMAEPRGFTHFRINELNPGVIDAEVFEALEIEMGENGQLFVVNFFKKKPDRDDEVFEVKQMVALAKQRNLE